MYGHLDMPRPLEASDVFSGEVTAGLQRAIDRWGEEVGMQIAQYMPLPDLFGLRDASRLVPPISDPPRSS
jgi:hypothetical protein